MVQLHFLVGRQHHAVDVGVIGGVGVDDAELAVTVNHVGMAAADGRVITDEVVHIASFLANAEHGLIQRNPLIVLIMDKK